MAVIANGTCGPNLTWELTQNGEFVIEGTGNMPYYTPGNTPWSSYASSIKSVSVGNGVTSVCDNAFRCKNLTNVTLGDSVESIGEYAFQYCYSLTNIVIPDSVTSIGNCAFEDCESLTSIIIPDSVTSIGHYIFDGCSSLTIYCEAASKPYGWSSLWNSYNCPVVWGYASEEPEEPTIPTKRFTRLYLEDTNITSNGKRWIKLQTTVQ